MSKTASKTTAKTAAPTKAPEADKSPVAPPVDAPAKEPTAAAAPSTDAAAKDTSSDPKPPKGARQYVTQWGLRRNGKRLKPGTKLQLTADEAAAIGACVKPVE